MWKIVERGRPQMTMWRMCSACWIPTATNTHSQYVILIAFPLQQWLHEHAKMVRYTYIPCIFFKYLHYDAGKGKIRNESNLLCFKYSVHIHRLLHNTLR